MAQRRGFLVVFAPETVDHMDAIDRKHHRLIKRAIDEQLTYTPERPTRNRKPLDDPGPSDASWELRCGQQNRFRVFYDVDGIAREVQVLAIGVKERDRLFIGGKEYTP